jgi:hypothetical protein
MGEEMPKKKKSQTSNILTIIVYLLLLIVALKLFRIIPDPPDIDVNLVIGILALAVAVSTTLMGWGQRQWSSLTDKIENLEKTNQALLTNWKVLEQKVSSLECNVDLRERIAKLEAITTKKR